MFRKLSVLILGLSAMPAMAQPLPAPELLGHIVLPSGLSLGGVTIGGISDLAYDSATGRYLGISDDRVEYGHARFYEFGLDVKDGVVRLDIAATRELRDEAGKAFAVKGIDGEGIAVDRKAGKLYFSSERDGDGQPAIYAVDLDLANVRRLELPQAYLVDQQKTKGVYNNLAFEGLTVAGDGRLIAATENALAQDGAKATLEAGSLSRLLVLDGETLTPAAEYIYRTEAISKAATAEPPYNDNGVSAIEALPDGRLVVVERSFAAGLGNHIRVFIADSSQADNIFGKGDIDAAAVKPVAKALWFEIDEGDFGLDIDNIESFAFGPVVDGRQHFVIASDDNFNPAAQFTQFAVFAIPALPVTGQ